MADMTLSLRFNDEASNTIRKIIREELDDTQLALECPSVNCNREARLENKVSGKLDLSPRQDGSGPSIWVDAYLCDVCMSRVHEGRKANMPAIWDVKGGCDCSICSLARAIKGMNNVRL